MKPSMQLLKTLFLRLHDLTQRYPWIMPVYGFISGLAGFFLVERQAEFAKVIAILLLVSWLWLMLENVFN